MPNSNTQLQAYEAYQTQLNQHYDALKKINVRMDNILNTTNIIVMELNIIINDHGCEHGSDQDSRTLYGWYMPCECYCNGDCPINIHLDFFRENLIECDLMKAPAGNNFTKLLEFYIRLRSCLVMLKREKLAAIAKQDLVPIVKAPKIKKGRKSRIDIQNFIKCMEKLVTGDHMYEEFNNVYDSDTDSSE